MSMKRHGGWAGIEIAAMMLCASAPAMAGEIRIWPTGVVQGEAIHLSEIADIRGFDAAGTEKLRSIIVSPSPKAGGELLVESGDVRAAVSEAQVNLADVSLVGASRCKVTRMHPAIARVEVKAPARHVRKLSSASAANPREITPQPATPTLDTVLREFITARVGESEGKVEIRFTPTCRQALQYDAAHHHFEIHQRDEAKLGLLTFEVEITGDNFTPKQVPVVAEVSLTREVVVAKRPINRGETIANRNLKLEQRRFTDFAQVGVTDLAVVNGQQARQLIRPGEMLLDRSVETRPVVRRGDPVTIWMRQGGLVIKASGRAQASGTLGERIEVARDGTRRKQDLIDAVITGPATVTVGDGPQVALAGDN
jgi:flagella basal body P-ring formation protein FlgA